MEDHFWIDPLGLEKEDERDASEEPSMHNRCVDSDSTDLSLKKNVIEEFLRSTQIAFDQIEGMHKYMTESKYPHLDPESLSSHQYEFLQFPDETTSEDDTFLLEVFYHLQKFSVVLFQILNETHEAEGDSEYHEKLNNMKAKMVRLLCDSQLAMNVSKLTPYENVTYEMLPAHLRQKRLSKRALRDYLFIRDYCKFIDYILNQKDNLSKLAS